jgi:tetratricopeptide (TPR) repeat protein
MNAKSESVTTRSKYVKAIGPKLRVVLWIVFSLLALLVPNSLFMAGITYLNWSAQGRENYQDSFYLWNFVVHLVLGLVLVVPFLVFGVIHIANTWNRKNWRAIRAGWAAFLAGVVVLVSGIVLPLPGMREGTMIRQVVYWLHVLVPLIAGWMYWLHRLSGPKIRWKMGLSYVGIVAATVVGMVIWKSHDPRGWNRPGPASSEAYFSPALARTSDGKFINAQVLQADEYCLKCHQDAYKGWFHSAHHFSSFNNPAYLASVRETRKVSLAVDGHVKAARFCAGCHDPVPFFAGKFDDPNYDDRNDPTAHAGISCTVCHAITHINGTRGNGDYTIEEPIHYPFAFSKNATLQWINEQLIKAKPSFHKTTFLKPLHRSAEFCSTCHKVHLPEELNKYKWLRGQNHYDSFLLSGVSGHGARSFYYPDHAKQNCAECHMPLQESNDFGAILTTDGKRKIHDHLFMAANTALPFWRDEPDIVKRHQDYLKDKLRVDIFGLKQGHSIDGPLLAPIRPKLPELEPGKSYLLETVIRTVGMGHHFTQGTTDSNEVWLDVVLKSGETIIGRSGGLDDRDVVDPWSHFVNVYMLDRRGQRIDRRNAQDIFTPLYNNQIPPGAGQIVHFGFVVPEKATSPISVEVKLLYRKFDAKYVEFIRRSLPGEQWPLSGNRPTEMRNHLPITVLAEDRVTLPIKGQASVKPTESPIPAWQRWNDYGIGLLLEGNMFGSKGELRQATEAFTEVEKLGRYDGPLNLARVYQIEGRLDDAVAALARAARCTHPPASTWTLNWLSGIVNRQQGHFEAAVENLRACLEDRSPDAVQRGFDFSRDYEVRFELAQTLFDLSDRQRGPNREAQRRQLLEQSRDEFEKVLAEDVEHLGAHYRLAAVYELLGNPERAEHHRQLHLKYKPDDNAQDRAIQIARQQNPAAGKVADRVVIYPLQRPGAFGMPSPTVTTMRKR